jgi:hypothetical protein
MRTQEEILGRIARIRGSDLMGFRMEVLVTALSFESAKQWRAVDCTAEQWGKTLTDEDFIARALEYLVFAMDKADSHRGISAGRSVEKLYEFAWLLGREDVMKAMDVAGYPQYGAPKLRAFAQTMGLAFQEVWISEVTDALVHMANGRPCDDAANFECGCGR